MSLHHLGSQSWMGFMYLGPSVLKRTHSFPTPGEPFALAVAHAGLGKSTQDMARNLLGSQWAAGAAKLPGEGCSYS